MSQIEELLRDTLSERNQLMDDDSGLLAAVHLRSRARSRSNAMAAGAGALCLATVVLLVGHGLLDRAARDRGSPAAPRVVAESALQPPTYVLPTFPFALEPRPAGLGDPVASLRGGALALAYPASTEAGPSLVVLVSAASLPDSSADRRSRDVRGHTATLGTQQVSDRLASVLSWQESTDQWVQMTAMGMSADQLIGYADALVPARLPLAAPFAFDLVPSGWLLTSMSAASMAFRPPTIPASADNQYELVIYLQETREAPSGTRIQVGERTGWLAGGLLSVDLGGGRTLNVQAPAEIGTTELIRFAAGVHVMANARAEGS